MISQFNASVPFSSFASNRLLASETAVSTAYAHVLAEITFARFVVAIVYLLTGCGLGEFQEASLRGTFLAYNMSKDIGQMTY